MTGLERATQMIGSKAVRLPLLLFCLLLLVRPAAATPRIFWEKTGEKRIFEGGAQKIRHLFRFRNEGDSQLRIERVRRTCGSCSVFNLSRKTLAPGAEAQGVATVLNAAAMTYVAATMAAVMQLIYFAMIVLGNRR